MIPRQLTVPVIKVTQPIGEFYIANISAKSLVEISFSDVRRIVGEKRDVERYLGIQRPLDEDRVKQIKKYLLSPDASFPTGVILAIDLKCSEYDPGTNNLTIKEYFPENYSMNELGEMVKMYELPEESTEEVILLKKVAKVLDGQHRIAAFTNQDGNFDNLLSEIGDSFNFNVVVFVGLDIDEQANIFATVNLAQTKVNRSLVYDLEGLSKRRSPFKTCHQIAVTLDSADPSSPLYKRIKRLGVKTKYRDFSEPLTQAVFVESLIRLLTHDPLEDRRIYMKGKSPKVVTLDVLMKFPFRNMFIGEKDTDIAVIIYNYFKAVQETWPTAWANINQEGNILPRSNAFKALMRYLRTAYSKLVKNEFGRVPTIAEFKTIFSNINVSDSDFTSGNFKPGSGGESAFYKLLIGEKTIQELKN